MTVVHPERPVNLDFNGYFWSDGIAKSSKSTSCQFWTGKENWLLWKQFQLENRIPTLTVLCYMFPANKTIQEQWNVPMISIGTSIMPLWWKDVQLSLGEIKTIFFSSPPSLIRPIKTKTTNISRINLPQWKVLTKSIQVKWQMIQTKNNATWTRVRVILITVSISVKFVLTLPTTWHNVWREVRSVIVALS